MISVFLLIQMCKELTYLRRPPPVAGVHVVVHPHILIIVGIVLFRLKNEIREELGISP